MRWRHKARAAQSRTPAPSDPARPVIVLGCHGGAGASTLAATLGPAASDWGLLRVDVVHATAPWPVLLVAQGTAYGAAKAVEAVAQFPSGSKLIVASVNDGWPEPLACRARLRALKAYAPVVRVPYVLRWRHEDAPTDVPAAYRRAVEEIRALVPAQQPSANQTVNRRNDADLVVRTPDHRAGVGSA